MVVLALLAVAPLERLGGSPPGAENRTYLLKPTQDDPASDLPMWDPNIHSDIALEQPLADPAMQPSPQSLPSNGPALLADLLPTVPAPMPSWLATWDGRSPATHPSLAADLSKQSPDAYADWLRSILPEGCTVRRQWAMVTAYCPCAICCDERTGRTATGRRTDIHPYGVASDFNLLRRGTKLHVPGYLTESTVGGIWPVDDTGGALRRSHARGVLHIDVRFVSHDWAERWGTRKMWIYVVSGPVQVNEAP